MRRRKLFPANLNVRVLRNLQFTITLLPISKNDVILKSWSALVNPYRVYKRTRDLDKQIELDELYWIKLFPANLNAEFLRNL